MNAVEWLRENGYCPPADGIYEEIEIWHQWYMSDVKSFYNYTVYNGQKNILCRRKSLGMARQACQDWADLLLNEKVKINHPSKEANDFLIRVMDSNNFWVRGNQCIENAFWSGLAAIVPHPVGVTVDRYTGAVRGAEDIEFTYCTGCSIIPLKMKNGECTECAFTYDTYVGNKKYTYLQIFTIGDNRLYSCENRLFDSTYGFEEKVDTSNITGFERMVPRWDTGLDIPPWVFIRPNIVNPRYPESPFGPAVFAGSIDIIQGIDSVYDAYVNEYVLGKTRVMVSTEALRFPNAGGTVENKPVFDPNELVFHVIPQGPTDQPYVNAIQPQIRAAEMQTGLNDVLSLFAIRCGFGEKHYQYNGGASVATATQVISENSHMFRTLKKHEIVLDAALKRLCKIILMYGNAFLGLGLDDDQDVTIDFDDSIIEDKQAQNNEMRADVAAGIIRPEIYISKKYGVGEEDARKMMPEVEAMAYA